MFGLGLYELANIVFLVLIVFLGPLMINYRLVKSRGRKNEICLWMFMSLLFSWIATFVLLIMKRKEA
jgi:hypothetical protein